MTAVINKKTTDSAIDPHDIFFGLDLENKPIPRSDELFNNVEEETLLIKCRVFQWLQVMRYPSPNQQQIISSAIPLLHPKIQISEDMMCEWVEEMLPMLSLFDTKNENDCKTNNNLNNNINNIPDWITLQSGNIGNELLVKHGIEDGSVGDRCLGCLLTVFMADALGAPVEGWDRDELIKKYPTGIQNFFPGTHMGARHKGNRSGYYTDDTMTTMALALSIVAHQKLDAQKVAENYANFWKLNPIYRGLPGSAIKVLNDVLGGMSILDTGRQSFSDGSYANGGAMRISSVGLAFRNASAEVLKSAVMDAILSSHIHLQSIDGALAIATAIQYLMKIKKENMMELNVDELFSLVFNVCKTGEMKKQLQIIFDGYQACENNDCEQITEQDINFLKKFKFLDFQIKAIEAVPMVFYCFFRWFRNPEQCIINIVSLGGDCDTTGAICGSLIGTLHGTAWIPKRWFYNLENIWTEDGMPFGKDLAIYLALELQKIDLVEHQSFEQKNNKGSIQ